MFHMWNDIDSLLPWTVTVHFPSAFPTTFSATHLNVPDVSNWAFIRINLLMLSTVSILIFSLSSTRLSSLYHFTFGIGIPPKMASSSQHFSKSTVVAFCLKSTFGATKNKRQLILNRAKRLQVRLESFASFCMQITKLPYSTNLSKWHDSHSFMTIWPIQIIFTWWNLFL